MNKIRVLAICLLATLIMSGLVTTIGLLTASAAAYYGVEVTQIAARFSWFIGGVFAGYIGSFFVFDHFRMKTIIISCYALTALAILSIHYVKLYALLPCLLLLIGITASICACAGSTLITRLCQGKQRQSVLVAQDAMFNGGGVVFAYTATMFISAEYKWSASYMVVAGICLFVLLLALCSSFSMRADNQPTADQPEEKTEWNASFIGMGLSLALFLLAKIAIFVWLPQFVEQKFAVSNASAGQLMSNIFISAFVGSLLGTYLVSQINVKYLLYSLVILAAISISLISNADNFTIVYASGFAFGLSISATYNSYVAFALTFIQYPNHRHIAYLFLAGGLGSALAPVLSSQFVEMTGKVDGAMYLCVAVFVICFITLIFSNAAGKRQIAA